MLGKIVQLVEQTFVDGFRVIEGVEFSKFGISDFRFAKLLLGENRIKASQNITYCWEFTVKKEVEGFKEILVNNVGIVDGKPEEKIVEEKLWVIIPYSSNIKTTAKKIAGRYPHEAILEMQAGDTVKVNKASGVPEVYMAVQAGNELFLIKKNR